MYIVLIVSDGAFLIYTSPLRGGRFIFVYHNTELDKDNRSLYAAFFHLSMGRSRTHIAVLNTRYATIFTSNYTVLYERDNNVHRQLA